MDRNEGTGLNMNAQLMASFNFRTGKQNVESISNEYFS